MGTVTRTTALALVAIATLASTASAQPHNPSLSGVPKAPSSVVPGHYIVVLKSSVEHPASVARDQTKQRGRELGFIYRHALNGYSAALSKDAVEALRQNPNVKYVAPDRRLSLFEQMTPTGVGRIFAATNESLGIDGENNARIDVDVAVIDTGVDSKHEDLEVFQSTDCSHPSEGGGYKCVDGSAIDEEGHGTHVAGIIGALDNDRGVVGVAPGARIWAAKVYTSSVSTQEGREAFESSAVAGVDWVTDHSNEIEAANISLGCKCPLPAFEEAIGRSIDAGVVYAIAAGNSKADTKDFSPAKYSDAITVSNLADYDGKSGGLGPELWRPSCSIEKQEELESQRGPDDTLTTTSNFGPSIDLTAPGSCIYSTVPGGGYEFKSGTSMASPHVAGAAALLAAQAKPKSKEDVEAIRNTLVEEGNYDWEDTSGDGIKEPLLDVSDESVFVGPPAVTVQNTTGLSTEGATLTAGVDAHGLEATYQFEYGLTSEYGSKSPASPKKVGSGEGAVAVGEAIKGLKPATTYHYRLITTNQVGTTYGHDHTFTTWGEWSLQSTANPKALEKSSLADVSCTAAGACLALGYDEYQGRALAQAWNGEKWAPAEGTMSLNRKATALSCATSGGGTFKKCIAIGEKTEGGFFSQRWEGVGSSWSPYSETALATPEGGSLSTLKGVSCTAGYACTAVGSYTKEGKTKALAERFNPEAGTWSVQTTATGPSEPVELRDVSCPTASECFAVGKEGAVTTTKPLIERWNGTSWSVQTSPLPPGITYSSLSKVSCPSTGACVATGAASSTEGGAAYAVRWDGKEWSLASSGLSASSDLSCTSSTSCIAVGTKESKTLMQAWDGSKWSAQSSPNPEGKTPSLSGVSCTSATACIAVGKASFGSGEAVTLGEVYK
jgi:subtilisin family serine protease